MIWGCILQGLDEPGQPAALLTRGGGGGLNQDDGKHAISVIEVAVRKRKPLT